jgi:excisionase family DNA binding protein
MSDLPRVSVRRKEAAEILGVSTDHIDDLIAAGDLRISKPGAIVLIEYASIIDYFERGRVA